LPGATVGWRPQAALVHGSREAFSAAIAFAAVALVSAVFAGSAGKRWQAASERLSSVA
jgi:Na+/glutamate symporter